MKKTILLLVLMIFVISLNTFADSNESSKYDYLVTISTDFGDIKLILFDDTPIHKNNFIKLAEEGAYDGRIFHRIIDNFMIQGGEIGEALKINKSAKQFTEGLLQAEIKHKHKRGSLAAARTPDSVNPEKKSSSIQFYIVENHAGTPHLDGNYTVFGQLMSGFDVVDKIAERVKNAGDKPLEEIVMTVKVEKVLKSDIEKFYSFKYSK